MPKSPEEEKMGTLEELKSEGQTIEKREYTLADVKVFLNELSDEFNEYDNRYEDSKSNPNILQRKKSVEEASATLEAGDYSKAREVLVSYADREEWNNEHLECLEYINYRGCSRVPKFIMPMILGRIAEAEKRLKDPAKSHEIDVVATMKDYRENVESLKEIETLQKYGADVLNSEKSGSMYHPTKNAHLKKMVLERLAKAEELLRVLPGQKT